LSTISIIIDFSFLDLLCMENLNFLECFDHNKAMKSFNFISLCIEFFFAQNLQARQTNCMTRMISRDYHFRYHSAYYIVYHRFLPKTYTKLFLIEGCCFCCCCFQCNFPYLIVGIRAWFTGRSNISIIIVLS
jgi:hypothetical protein